MKGFIRRVLHIEPEIIRVEVPRYVEIKRWTPEVNCILDCIQWNKGCLKSREDHPEYYEATEDVPAEIERLKLLLAEKAKGLIDAL